MSTNIEETAAKWSSMHVQAQVDVGEDMVIPAVLRFMGRQVGDGIYQVHYDFVPTTLLRVHPNGFAEAALTVPRSDLFEWFQIELDDDEDQTTTTIEGATP